MNFDRNRIDTAINNNHINKANKFNLQFGFNIAVVKLTYSFFF